MLELQSMERQSWEGTYPNFFPPSWQTANFIVRFVIGRPLDNRVRTDASFWHPATGGYPSRWLRLPGYKRALVRLSLAYLVPLLVFLSLAARLGFSDFAWRVFSYHALGILVIVFVVRFPTRVREKGLRLPTLSLRELESGWRLPAPRLVEVVEGRERWERERVVPVAKAIRESLHLEDRLSRPHEARKWITVPRSYLSPTGRPVVINLPAHFTGADEKQMLKIVRTVSGKLGAKEMVPEWQLAGDHPRLLLRAPELPPEKVLFAEVRHFFESAEEYRPFMGLVSPTKALNAEMIEDSPHILVNAGPGAGKSALLKNLIAHFGHWGWGILVLDWKMTKEFEWLKGLPGVTYISEIEAIHDMGVRLGEEVEIRKRNGMAGRAKLLIVRDEWNVTSVMLAEFWQTYRAMLEPEERRITPTRSPALQGFAKVDFGGREFGMHDLLSAQKASNRIFNFNTDMRDCFQIRCLARYSQEAKRMLVGNMKPFPKKSNIPGRWTIVAGEDVAVVQSPWLENEEAREWFLSGHQNPLFPFTSSFNVDEVEDGVTGVTLEDMPTTQAKQLTHGVTGVTAADDGSLIVDGEEVYSPRPMTLKQCAENLENMGITLKILQHATNRPGEKFPGIIGGNQFRGYEYDFNQVKQWAARRKAAAEAERVKK